ncbi:MAG: glycerophosphodiester phosphodiesterase family protein [Saprospiraceae bacterium]
MTVQKQIQPFLWLMFAALPFFACKYGLKNKPIDPVAPAAPMVPQAAFDWQGHRGFRGHWPENTLEAFLYAAKIPEVVTLELDLAVSKDKQLIVSHDPWFDPAICRKHNGDTLTAADSVRYLLYDLTAAEIKKWDCGSRGNPKFPEQQKIWTHKPTFREAVFEVRKANQDHPMRWNVEIKSQPDWDSTRTPPVEEFAKLVVDEIRFLRLEDMVTVQSFDVRALQAVKRLNPKLKLVLLVANIKGLDRNLKLLGFSPDAYSPHYQLVSAKMVADCHKKQIKVIPWTVNDVATMRGLIQLGVDGIITDYPNLIQEVYKVDKKG